MHAIDYSLIAIYLAALLWLGLKNRSKVTTVADLILDGRRLTLPAFVASLVSTWYGGILGVGEYSYQYGISNWLVFGAPYYLAAIIFALVLSKKARQSKLVTIPERLAQVYDNKTALVGAIIVFMMTVPAAYILMLGVLGKEFFGWPLWIGVICGTIFSIVYVYFGAFRSVVRTDILQFVLMFAGFVTMTLVLVSEYGGFGYLKQNLPVGHFTWHGGNSGFYIATWYFIALATLIEPAFYQRCYAVKSTNVSTKGIFVSIFCWIIFDFLTTVCGLYAKAILPDLTDPVASYPALAKAILPAGLLGVFAVALLSTIMSTVDSYSFIAASTFGNDIIPRFKRVTESQIIKLTQFGLILAAAMAIVWALFFQSAVDIWHAFGSIATPALLVPVLTSFVGKRRLNSKWAFVSIISSGGISLVWYFSNGWTTDGTYWFGLEPIFSGLFVSLVIFFVFARPNIVSDLQQSNR